MIANDTSFTDLHPSLLAWVVLGSCITILIAFDLWRHRDDHEPTAREALKETIFYIVIGLLFGVGVLFVWGGEAAGEYYAGYLVEKSLSVDNVFVWALLFAGFATPLRYQHRVLFWGIFGALVLRGVFVFAGTALLAKFWWMIVVFGIVLLVSGVKVIRHRDDETEPSHNLAMRLLSKVIPVSDSYDGHKFTTRVGKKLHATPLLAALIVIEATDIVFAVDSVPAILAVSREPYLVLASNAFAILGLRALYFLLADARNKFHYLSHALGLILVFVGIKMLGSHWWHISTTISLLVIATVLVLAVWASRLHARLEKDAPPVDEDSAQVL